MTDEQRWEILKLLGLSRRRKAELWLLLNEVVQDAVLLASVVEILALLLRAKDDPTVLLFPQGVAPTGEPEGALLLGLKRADTVEFYEGAMSHEVTKLYEQLLLDLANLIGWENECGGDGYGFS